MPASQAGGLQSPWIRTPMELSALRGFNDRGSVGVPVPMNLPFFEIFYFHMFIL
jgi:hypothetical protein